VTGNLMETYRAGLLALPENQYADWLGLHTAAKLNDEMLNLENQLRPRRRSLRVAVHDA